MRAFVADALALLIFFTPAGALKERFVAGTAWEEAVRSGAIGATLMVATARACGVWRDWLSPGSRRSLGAVAPVLLIFQVPVCAAILRRKAQRARRSCAARRGSRR